jgi:hypothetical protein
MIAVLHQMILRVPPHKGGGNQVGWHVLIGLGRWRAGHFYPIPHSAVRYVLQEAYMNQHRKEKCVNGHAIAPNITSMMPATPRILIVDDEPLILLLLTLTFQRAGYQVITAGSGRDAIALCSAESFDVLLSDITMPGMDGYQLTQWVSAHCPGVRTALMSGYDAVCAWGPDPGLVRVSPSRSPARGTSASPIPGHWRSSVEDVSHSHKA